MKTDVDRGVLVAFLLLKKIEQNCLIPKLFYIYSPDGRLLGISVPVTLNVNGETKVEMYPVKAYIWGGNRVLCQIDALADASYYYLYNGHGDVVAMTDTSGNILNAYDYDIWGNFITKNETVDNPFTYFGQTYDETTGLYYLRARYYDPATGRFTQQDPAEDGYNWYVYGNQNPAMYVDPSGHISQTEMDMFENGQMAPMAYTYLMNLTYQWYLADDEFSKNQYHQWAEDFRETGYSTTNGLFPDVDGGIEFMPTLPTGVLNEEQHYFRNKLNLQFEWNTFQTLNERLPDNLKWRELPLLQSVFHKFSLGTAWQGNNRKYVSACEHFELVYTKENHLVDSIFSSEYMRTYNYYGPSQADKHKKHDVDTYFLYGNIR